MQDCCSPTASLHEARERGSVFAFRLTPGNSGVFGRSLGNMVGWRFCPNIIDHLPRLAYWNIMPEHGNVSFRAISVEAVGYDLSLKFVDQMPFVEWKTATFKLVARLVHQAARILA